MVKSLTSVLLDYALPQGISFFIKFDKAGGVGGHDVVDTQIHTCHTNLV